MREPKQPCWGCEDRTPTCHTTCEKYKEWDKAHKEYKKIINQEINTEMRDYVNERCWKQ